MGVNFEIEVVSLIQTHFQCIAYTQYGGEIRTITTNRASLSKRERERNHVGFLVWNSIVLRIEARNIFGIRHCQWMYVHIWVNKVGFWGASRSKLSHIGAKCSSLVENINMEYSQSISKFRIHMCIECSIVWHCFLVLAFFRVCVCVRVLPRMFTVMHLIW